MHASIDGSLRLMILQNSISSFVKRGHRCYPCYDSFPFLIETMKGIVRTNGIVATANGKKWFGSSSVQMKLPIIGPIIAPAPKDAELKP